jgi:protocatechuate 3,4-dioxygenase beta subunit
MPRVVALCLLGLLLLTSVGVARQSTDDRVTAAPGKETPETARLIDQAKAALSAGKSTSEILTDKAYLPVHAWPRFRDLIRQQATTGLLRVTVADEPGTPLQVQGVVRNGRGEPVPDALMYFYHTSSKGWYSDRAAHFSGNGGDFQHARLFGYLKTDASGRFEFRTIRPAGYPRTDLPAHIHVFLTKTGHPELGTEILFDDDPRLTASARTQSQQAGFVICPVRQDGQGVQHVNVEFRLKD